MTGFTLPTRRWRILVARMDGTRFHAATVNAPSAAAARDAFERNRPSRYGFGFIALDRDTGVALNPSAPEYDAEGN